MRGLVVVACALLVLAAAPAARAEVTIGSELTARRTPALGARHAPCGSTSIPGRTRPRRSAGSSRAGAIRAGDPRHAVRLVVIRRPRGDRRRPGEVVARSAPLTPPASDGQRPPPRGIRISAGDYIGLECCDGAERRLPGADLPGRRQTSGRRALTCLRARPRHAPPRELLVNADIEPDLDGDGFGDETQDNCDGDGEHRPSDPDRRRPRRRVRRRTTTATATATAADAARRDRRRTPDGCPARLPPAARAARQHPAGRALPDAARRDRGARVADDRARRRRRRRRAEGDGVRRRRDDLRAVGAPYSCTWRPTGADVGRATLLASAVDSDNRSTLGIVRVSVARFRRDLTRRVRGRKVTGRLVLPAAVERALGCRGEVTVRRGPTTADGRAEAQLHLQPSGCRAARARAGALRGQLGRGARHLDSWAR